MECEAGKHRSQPFMKHRWLQDSNKYYLHWLWSFAAIFNWAKQRFLCVNRVFTPESAWYFTEFHRQFQKQTKAEGNKCGIQCKDFSALSNIILQFGKAFSGLNATKQTIECTN